MKFFERAQEWHANLSDRAVDGELNRPAATLFWVCHWLLIAAILILVPFGKLWDYICRKVAKRIQSRLSHDPY